MENKLMKALESGKFKLATILIQGGHDVNFSSNKGISPLMLACKFEALEDGINPKLDIIHKLLENKANIHATDNEGRTALVYAMHSKCKATITMLKKQGLVITIEAKTKKIKGHNKMLWDSFDLDEE
ncbi:ankyrin repeat domain-containing protein 34B-like [Mytilus trossulus]|uniref:ankyrin repeat domain-containing protein 34B-like n=1 Tax=Mytilus trossulus TaxID=6551 RepID=UPI0030055722